MRCWHPAVAECGVVGQPDEERGMVVKAYCVLKPGHEGDAAMVRTLQGTRQGLDHALQVPARDRIRPGLPRTETGKLQRFKLRQR